MKSDKLRKTIVSFALIVFAAILLLFAACCWGIVELGGVIEYFESGNIAVRVLIGILFVMLAVCVFYAVIQTIKLGKKKNPAEMNTLVQNNAGTSYISSDAVAGMIQRILKRNSKIKSANCTVNPVEDGIVSDVQLVVFSGGDLTKLCSDIQQRIKSEVETATGIPVRNVSVSIVQTVEGNTPVEKRVN